MKSKALIIVDVQQDFCPGEAIAVPQGDQIIPYINSISTKFESVVASQDWHPPNHISFASIHNLSLYQSISVGKTKQTLWPSFFVNNTKKRLTLMFRWCHRIVNDFSTPIFIRFIKKAEKLWAM